MKVFTIIDSGRLLGTIKLADDVIPDLTPDKAILLEQQINCGDSQLVTFRIRLVPAGSY